MKNWLPILILAVLLLGLQQCSNNPWPKGWAADATYFTSYAAQIKSLDPTTANFTHESAVVDNIVEPPLAYDYLKRPYQLIPQLLTEIPQPVYYDANHQVLPGDPPAGQVAAAEYTLHLRPGIRYAPHPCFAPSCTQIRKHPRNPQEFGIVGTREVTAMDFKTGLVRLCDPRLSSTVYSSLSSFIAGMPECSAAIAAEVLRLDGLRTGESPAQLAALPSLPDYRQIPFAGLEVVDDRTVKITLKRKYPQFVYWLAMHYLAPIPYEALEFYRRADVRAAGFSWEQWPVGTGAFLLCECDPNSRIILARNPEYHEVRFPEDGGEDAGKKLPFLDRVVFNYERESIPNWIKFQQGYYDNSGIPSDMFDNAVAMNPSNGELALSPEMAATGMRLTRDVPPISYYFAFNMLDSVVGGLTPQKRALRQALSIVLDTREYVAIFKNGNGIPAEGILPPGVFGQPQPPADMNHVINEWDEKTGESRRKALSAARALMAEAGYPNGIDPATGEPLAIHLDHAAAGLPDFKNRFQWLASKFRLLGVELVERPSDLNRNREKLDTGNWQFLFERGWVADYPDPENFLFLFAGANGHVKTNGRGPNYTNYDSPEYDALFQRLETMPNNGARLALIRQASEILYRDAPMCWDYHPVNVILTHRWLHNYKPTSICYDNLKYLRIDAQDRMAAQRRWNRPRKAPVALALIAITALWYAGAAWRSRQLHAPHAPQT